jgi:ABC-type nitrate/sulfonate/bicarbonate transport system substrate-binding protein
VHDSDVFLDQCGRIIGILHAAFAFCVASILLTAFIFFIPNGSGITSDRIATPKPAEAYEKIRVGYQQTSMYAHLFISKEKGYFEQKGIQVDLVPFNSANQMMEALISERIDIAGLTNLEVGLKVEEADPGKFKFLNFVVWSQKSHADYLIVNPLIGIDQISQLEGRRIGLHPGSAVRAFAINILKIRGVDPLRCEFLELPPSSMVSALELNQVDALYCMDPTATFLTESGVGKVLVEHPLGILTNGGDIPIAGTAVSSRYANAHRSTVSKFRSALDQGISFLENPENIMESQKLMSTYLAMPVSDISGMKPASYWRLESIRRERLQNIADKFKEIGVVSKPVTVSNLLLDDISIDLKLQKEVGVP